MRSVDGARLRLPPLVCTMTGRLVARGERPEVLLGSRRVVWPLAWRHGDHRVGRRAFRPGARTRASPACRAPGRRARARCACPAAAVASTSIPRSRSSFVSVATLLDPCGQTMPWQPGAIDERRLARQIVPVHGARRRERRVEDHERAAHRLGLRRAPGMREMRWPPRSRRTRGEEIAGGDCLD